MSDDMGELARRLVVGRKSDGRSVYDEAVKAELVAACVRPGASVSRLARECGINANQLSRWIREHSQRRQRAVVVPSPTNQTFVAVPIGSAAPMPMVTGDSLPATRMPATLLMVGDVLGLIAQTLLDLAANTQRLIAGRSRPRPAGRIKPHPRYAYKG